jgi:MFS family permease
MKRTPSMRRLPLTVIVLGLTSFFTDVASEMVFPLLPAFLTGLGAGATFLGLLEGLADALSAGLKYLAGGWADRARARGSRKALVVLGYALATLVRPLLALATAPWHVLAVRLTDRTGKGLRSAPRDALIADSVPPEDTGRAFGVHQAMDHAGAVVGPLLATGLVALGLEVRTIFALTLVPGLLAVAAALAAREPPRMDTAQATSSAEPLAPRLKQLLVVLAVFAVANSSDAFLLLRVSQLGAPTAWLPLVWLTLNASRMVWTARGGVWADRWPRHRLLAAGWGLYALCYLALAVAPSAAVAWGIIAVYGASAGLTEPSEKALVKALASPGQRARAFGAFHGLTGAAAIPAGLLTGGLWQALGAPVALAASGGVAALAAGLALLWARRGAGQGAPPHLDSGG